MTSKAWAVLWIMVAMLLRGVEAFYALGQVCLTPAAEQPLATGQAFSVLAHSVGDAHALRWLGVLTGALTVALTAASAQALRARWRGLATAIVAVAPPFVWADRWLMGNDGALLCVAASVWVWLVWRGTPHKAWARALLIVSTGGLLLCAPTLWWLAAGLWLWARLSWRDAAFAVGMVALLVILTRQPFAWLAQGGAWDEGATAAMLWLLLAAAVYRLPVPPPALLRALGIGVLALLISTVLILLELPRPTAEEWQLVADLQAHIADDSVVLFDRASAHLAPHVACPLGANVRMTWHALGAFMPDVTPDYTVLRAPTDDHTHRQPLANGYTLVRHIDVPNPRAQPFGEQVLLLGYLLAQTDVQAGDLLDLRLDWQFTDKLGAQATVYAGFVHVTLPDQPTEKAFELSYPFIAEMGSLRPRSYNLNQHVRFVLPSGTPSGTYDVVFGVYDTQARRELGRVTIARLRVNSE